MLRRQLLLGIRSSSPWLHFLVAFVLVFCCVLIDERLCCRHLLGLLLARYAVGSLVTLEMLAHLLALGILPEGYIYPKHERPVRDLLRRRSFLVKKRTSFLLAMRGAFECRTGMRTTSNEVKQWTCEEVESHLDDPLSALGITCLLEPMRALNDQIRIIEKETLKRARLRDEFAPLLTVWGIGKILALTMMYEVGEIARFRKVGNFASYCRLVKSARLSAGKRKGSGNPRNGNPYLSWAFSEAAHYAVRYYPPAKKYFQRKMSKTNGIIAIRALAHKLARAAYYVMKDQVDFDPDKVFR